MQGIMQIWARLDKKTIQASLQSNNFYLDQP